MCAGAMIHSRVARLVFGAYDCKRGAVNSTAHAFDAQGLNHQIEVCGGVLEQHCADRLRRFFAVRRG
jgi:tRNA(adenine34) deaminase